MKRLLTVVALLVVPGLCVRADDPEKKPVKDERPAAEVLAAGLEQAKKEGKSAFLIFGSPSCGWCKYLDKYHADPEVAKVVGKYFVLVKVCVVTNPGGEDLYAKHGENRGVPAFTILDAAGKTLADSGNGKDNVGFPYEVKEIEHYVAVVRKTCPKITDAEIDVLTRKLKEIGPKKDK